MIRNYELIIRVKNLLESSFKFWKMIIICIFLFDVIILALAFLEIKSILLDTFIFLLTIIYFLLVGYLANFRANLYSDYYKISTYPFLLRCYGLVLIIPLLYLLHTRGLYSIKQLAYVVIGSLSSAIIVLRVIAGKKSVNILKEIDFIISGKWLSDDFINNATSSQALSSLDSETTYQHKDSIAVFQSTILSPEINAEESYKKLKDYTKGIELKVLDIGGGEGLFTKSLLDKVNQHSSVNSVKLVDPVDFSEEYKINVSKVCPEANLVIANQSFQHWISSRKRDEKYNLILASHSLYEMVDNGYEFKMMIDKLKQVKSVNSKLLVILASNEGRAYRFKNRCLTTITSKNNQQLTSEKFIDQNDYTFINPSNQIDNYFDLTALLNDNSQYNLKLWLSYFLRIDINLITPIRFQILKRILEEFVQPLYELEESTQSKLKSKNRCLIEDSLILTHKSDIITFTLDNIYV